MTITVQAQTAPSARAIFLLIAQGADVRKHSWFRKLPAAVQQTVLAFVKAQEFTGKADEVRVIPFGTSARAVVLLGLGDPKAFTHRQAMLACRKVVNITKQHRLEHAAVALPDIAILDWTVEHRAQLAAENFQLAHYEYTTYRTTPPGGWPQVKSIALVVPAADVRAAQRGARAGSIIGQATNSARDLSNTPGSDMTPTILANAAVAAGKRAGFSVTVLKKDALEKLGMGGVLGVARGSTHAPTFTVLEYAAVGQKKDAPIVYLGKGVTFDSGGLNLKPSASMYEMHMDMSGGAAVISALTAIAQLKLPVRVIGLIPAVENVSAGDAYRPGDQLRSLSGKTIEVMDTDAEGRIILADALTYAEQFKPAAVIDVATLTGAALHALGQHASAILSPDDNFSRELQNLAEQSGDFGWPLPLWPEYEAEIRGMFGDVSNTGKSRYGGAITGAAFLWQFAKKFKRWAHVDIAPTMTTIDGQHLAKGSAGAGTRLLIAYARSPRDAAKRSGRARRHHA
ncbi:MAG: leucyl aminopeptidase [Patescibacteria group bacterium]